MFPHLPPRLAFRMKFNHAVTVPATGSLGGSATVVTRGLDPRLDGRYRRAMPATSN